LIGGNQGTIKEHLFAFTESQDGPLRHSRNEKLNRAQGRLIEKVTVQKEKANNRVRMRLIAEETKESICGDKDDIPIMGTALSGHARFVITGDEDLLVLKKYKDVEIITPRKF
jgi:predicted nucleic acid-binding protein